MSISRRRFIESTIGAGILLPQASALASLFENKANSCAATSSLMNSFCTYHNIQAQIISKQGDIMSDSFEVPPLQTGLHVRAQ